MNWWSRRGRRRAGWLSVSLEPGRLCFVHGDAAAGSRPRIERAGVATLAEDAGSFERSVRDLELDRYQCSVLLAAGEYQVLLVEAPNVPPAELKTAIRWKLKDMLDYHVDDATVDVLDLPPGEGGPPRARSMYAIAARNDIVERHVAACQGAGLGLAVIEIPETAQRNLAALYEEDERGVAMLYFGPQGGLLTVNYRRELYFSRRLEIESGQLVHPDRETKEEIFSRVLVELQRTLDHIDRQFPFVAVRKLYLGPEREDSGLLEFLAANLDLPVERVMLAEALDFGAEAAVDGEFEWRAFHLLGAALRHEGKAL